MELPVQDLPIEDLPVKSSVRLFPNLRPSVATRALFQVSCAPVLLALILIAGCKNPLSVQQPVARTDQQVTSDIQAKIQGESALAGQNIQVSVSNGVATLNGMVSDDASRALAANDSGTVSGVRTVVDNLTVQSANTIVRSRFGASRLETRKPELLTMTAVLLKLRRPRCRSSLNQLRSR